MDKPISVRITEFKAAVEAAINSAGLPAYIVEPVLGSYYMQVVELAKQQTEEEALAYADSMEAPHEKGVSE